MEILEHPDGQSCWLRLTKEEWIELGDDYGYLTPERRQQLTPPDDLPISSRHQMSGRMIVRMANEPYETFGIYIRKSEGEEGKLGPEELLCKLTSYRDALAVILLIRGMAERIAVDRARKNALARSLRGEN